MSKYIHGRRMALRVVGYQCVAAVLLGLIGFAINSSVALSLFIGASICVAAQLWLAWVGFGPKLGVAPAKMLSAFYLGAIGKFCITAGLLMLAFGLVEWLKAPTYAACVILGYLATQLSVWVVPKAG